MSQPTWKLVAQLGDVNTIDHGGHFVYVDETGVYAPEAEVLTIADETDGAELWEIHRYILEPCTYVAGILSDNPYHPELPAWFADSLPDVVAYVGSSTPAMIADLCGDDLTAKALAWKAIGDYHGMDNLDSYPTQWADRAQLEARYGL